MVAEIDLMSNEEYLGWQEFYEIEPFGVMVQDAAQAHIASVLANVNRDSRQRPNAYTLKEFLIFEKQEEAEPMLFDDPEAQSELIKKMLFGKRNN